MPSENGWDVVRYVRMPIDELTDHAIERLRDGEGRLAGWNRDADFLRRLLGEALFCVVEHSERRGCFTPGEPAFQILFRREEHGEPPGRYFARGRRYDLAKEYLAVNALLERAGRMEDAP